MTTSVLDAPALPSWYDDLCSCLQMTVGCVLERHGWDPVQALGSGWRYAAPNTPVEPVEYYHPAGDRLGESFCLHHPVRLAWHHPHPDDARTQLSTSLRRGLTPIVAVNNFHLPFRPAYHDVHAAHLILVTAVDEARDEVLVHDPMPPAYRGPLPREVLDRARESLPVEDDSDPFFAGSRPARRWLEVDVHGPQPDPSQQWVASVMRDNLAALDAPHGGPSALASALRRITGGGPDTDQHGASIALRDVYVLGWPAQAEAGLHASFLAAAARTLRRPDLAETARSVAAVAHAWTGLRLAAAHAARTAEGGPARAVALGQQLVRRWQDCLAGYRRVAEEDER